MADVETWALVLAAGEGSRLRSLTTQPCGTAVPKQFCSLKGDRTLLEDAIVRAKAITSPTHICAIVAEQHRPWWTSAFAHLPTANVITQPCNRGTAIGILYPLLHILGRDPAARVVILPSDHYVRQESVLQHTLRAAVQLLASPSDAPILLGVQPDEADPELGYIIPGKLHDDGGRSILRFVEKPSAKLAIEIISQGALWNTFIIAASAQGLLELFDRRYPSIVQAMQAVVALSRRDPNAAHALLDLYERLPQIDFSRDVLEVFSSSLRVMRVPACGWSDLGTPRRLAETLRRLESNELRPRHVSSPNAPINLALQHAHHERLTRAESRPRAAVSMVGKSPVQARIP